MPAFKHEALWNKSKIFVDRALQARDDNDEMAFHIWASMGLELLGKAALSHVHPALVADPNHFNSLLAACGGSTGTGRRSVTAKTVFERLRSISTAFDERMSRECMVMADRRNAELHSGESPLVGLDPRNWVPAFWKAASVLVATQEKTLEDWLGPDEAARVAAILLDTAEVHRQTVLARIARRAAEFALRSPAGTQQLQHAEQRARIRPAPPASSEAAYNMVTCPGCGLDVWALGYEADRELIDEQYDEDEYYYHYLQIWRVFYGIETLACPECELVLEGREEIEIAEVDADFDEEREEEPDLDEEYGNE